MGTASDERAMARDVRVVFFADIGHELMEVEQHWIDDVFLAVTGHPAVADDEEAAPA